MTDASLVRTGVIGSVIAAICCFTPILAITLGAVGLSAWLGWLDYVLLPALALSLGLVAYGMMRQRRTADCGAPATPSNTKGR